MEDVTFYKKIVYKKNAFDDLKTYIKINHSNKKILLVSTKSISAEDVTSVLNALFSGSEFVSHFVARENFSLKELNALNQKIDKNGYDVLIAFGGGKCADVVKYFAYNYNTSYVVCPTVATSLAYFTNYCINPFDSTKSFYANMPNKIFVSESIIKNSSCYLNISGLCFLHALRAVYVEGVVNNIEKEQFIFVGLDKLFSKLENEQTNILVCNEDSNLVLMDIFIDFGFFISMLPKENYFLFNMYEVYRSIGANEEMSGRNMLACCCAILYTLKNYLELKTIRVLEKCNYDGVASILKGGNIHYKALKNNQYFNDLNNNIGLKKDIIDRREKIYKEIIKQLKIINNFSKKVKSVYKYGIEIDDEKESLLHALSVTPFIYGNNALVDLMAGSGVLNAFLGWIMYK